MISDRLGTRRRVLIVSAIMIATGVGLLSIVNGLLIIAAVVLAGLTRDGFMAVLMTLIIEIRGIGATFAGTATGFIMACSMLARALAPPLGNSLAAINPSLPFLLWAAMAVIGLLGIFLVREGVRSSQIATPE
jgi:MFS family permease